MLDGSSFHDAEPHPTEQLTATQILAQSSNIGTSEIAQGVGEQRLLDPGEVARLRAADRARLPWRVARAPGDGRPVGADRLRLAAHRPGGRGQRPPGARRVQRRRQRRRVRRAEAGPGHGEPVGHAGARRRRHRPTRRSHLPWTPSCPPCSQQVVDQGTGTSAVVPGYTVAGKTGTAQIPTPDHDSYITGRLHGVLRRVRAGGESDAVDDRRPRPPTPIFGGTVAAPVFSQIMSYALHRYDIPTTPGAQTSPSSPGTTSRVGRATRPRTSRDHSSTHPLRR